MKLAHPMAFVTTTVFIQALLNSFLCLPSQANYEDFLLHSGVKVSKTHEGAPKEFPGGHDEKYWAEDAQGAKYKLRLKNPLPNFAEVGASVLIDLMQLPNAPVHPILLKRGEDGVPTAKDLANFGIDSQYAGKAGNRGEWFPGTIQPVVQLKPYDEKNLTGKQLAELTAHLLANYALGNEDSPVGNGVSGNLGFDGTHFYTLDATQSFKTYRENPRDGVGAYLGQIKPLLQTVLKRLSHEERQVFASDINDYLTRLERIRPNELEPALGHYFIGMKNFRKSKGKEEFDYWKEFKRRQNSVRMETLGILTENASIPELLSLRRPTLAIPKPQHLPKTSLNLGDLPSTQTASKKDLLWSYYFQDYWNTPGVRDSAATQWSRELGLLDPSEVIPHLQGRLKDDPVREATPVKAEEGEEASFDGEARFPNYFLSTKHSKEELKNALNQAMATTIRQLDIPYVNRDGKLVNAGFTENLLSRVTDAKNGVDPGARVLLSGGVVRSLLGYIYQKIYKAKRKHPEMDTLDILKGIGTRDKSLPSFRALGIGSDFDVLVIPTSENHAVPVTELTKNLVNSAREHLGLTGNMDPLVTSLVPFGDVNPYSKQTARAIANGGSTLDFLAFDLSSQTIKTPDAYPHIVDQFLEGRYDYVAGTQREDSDATTVRGIRPRVEIPFLKTTRSGGRLLTQELNSLLAKVSSGGKISDVARKQFEKAARNGRFGAGGNRIFESQDPVDIAAKNIVLKFHGQSSSLPVIPKFIECDHGSCGTKATQHLPSELLMDPETFQLKHTAKGQLYHGTGDPSNFLKILRNGLILSTNSKYEDFSQGAASYGPGAYSTNDLSIVQDYAREGGLVIPIGIRWDSHPKIINWAEVKSTPFMKALEERAKKEKRDVFNILAKDFGVDIIVNHHVILENSAVLKLPKNLRDLLQVQSDAMADRFEDPSFGSYAEHYFKTYALAQSLNQTNLPRPQSALLRIAQKVHPASTASAHPFLDSMKFFLNSSDSNHKNVGYFFADVDPSDQHELFSLAIHHADPEIRVGAARALYTYKDHSTAEELWRQALKDENGMVRKHAALALKDYPGEHVNQIFRAAFHASFGENRSNVSDQDRYNPYGPSLSPLDLGIALGRRNEPETDALISEFLKSSDERLQEGAVAAAFVRPGGGLHHLKELLSQYPHLDWFIAKTIAKSCKPKDGKPNFPVMQGGEAQAALELFLSHENIEIRRASVKCFELFYQNHPALSTELEGFLKKAISDPDSLVRSSAINSMDNFPVKNIKSLLIPVLTHGGNQELRDYTVPAALFQIKKAGLSDSEKEDLISKLISINLHGVEDLLGDYDGPKGSRFVQSLLSDPKPHARRTGIRHLDKIPGTTQALRHRKDEYLLKAFDDSDEEVRREAARVLGKYTGERGHDLFEKGLADPEWNVRTVTAQSLGNYVATKDAPFLPTFIHHSNPLVRRGAFLAMAESKFDEKTQYSWIERGLRDSDPQVVEAAGQALTKYTGSGIKELYEIALQKVTDTSVPRESDSRLLSELCEKTQSFDLAFSWLRSSERNKKLVAIRALAKHQPRGQDQLIPLLEDSDLEIRRATAETLTKSDQDHEKLLSLILRNSDEQVREAGVRGIWQAPNGSIKSNNSLLRNLLNSTDDILVAAALKAMSSYSFQNELMTPCEIAKAFAKKGKSSEVRAEAIKKIALCSPQEALHSLKEAYLSSDPLIRKACISALQSIPIEEGGEDLLAHALADEDEGHFNDTWTTIQNRYMWNKYRPEDLKAATQALTRIFDQAHPKIKIRLLHNGYQSPGQTPYLIHWIAHSAKDKDQEVQKAGVDTMIRLMNLHENNELSTRVSVNCKELVAQLDGPPLHHFFAELLKSDHADLNRNVLEFVANQALTAGPQQAKWQALHKHITRSDSLDTIEKQLGTVDQFNKTGKCSEEERCQ